MHSVFVSGGTGYLGRALVARLVARGHAVRALARRGSEQHVPKGAEVVIGNALDSGSFAALVAPARTFVHLVGAPRPGPFMARQFREIDFAGAVAAAEAAIHAGVAHFVYVAVARPAPIMKAYQEARADAEAQILVRGLNATFLRPWYVTGPGHQWARALAPLYWVAERIPATRDLALRCGLVTHAQMIHALVTAVENPVLGVRTINVPDIRRVIVSE